MDASTNALKLVQQFEGFRANPYLDVKGIPTIGWGFTRYANGTPVTMKDRPMSQADADALLLVLLNRVAVGVTKLVTVALSQNELDALVCFAYNVGLGALAGSTLLRLLNAGNHVGAAGQFRLWDHAGEVEVAGLERRRLAEAALFTT